MPDDIKIVMNAGDCEEQLCMFYNNDMRVFDRVIDKEYIDSFNEHHIKFATFAPRQGYDLPYYVLASPQAYIIPVPLEAMPPQ